MKMILDLLYPGHCPFSDSLLPYGSGMVCERCLSLLKPICPPVCLKCGKSIEDPEMEYCEDCTKIPKHFARGFPVFSYKEPVKTAIYQFKYENQKRYGVFFADCVADRYGTNLKALAIDGIVPVPLHPKKKRKRGFNQAECIAVHLGKRLKVPVYPNYLKRIVNTNPQKELSDKERMKNIKNAFKMNQNTIKLKKILLVDDIYTSGATVEAWTEVLTANGVEAVYYTSVAIGKGY